MSQTLSHPADQSLPKQPTLERIWPAAIEFALLVLVAPLLYYPDRVQAALSKVCGCEIDWGVELWIVGAVILALLWPLRRWLTGRWAASMPVAWVLWFWFLVMLPVSIWVAPPILREQYSWPRGYILLWNFSLFWSILSHASQSRRALGWALVGWVAAVQALAMIAPLGMEARAKLPLIGRIQELIPRPLMGQFSGPESGFSTNQVAGVLLYALPLMIAICVVGLRQRGWRWLLLLICTGMMGASFVLTQSRGGYLGLLVALVTLILLTQRWGWYALAALCAAGAFILFYTPSALIELISDTPGVGSVGGVATVRAFRFLVWDAALQGMQDFFFTGMGLGTFRALVFLLYPLPGIPFTYDLAHAHNFFLQTGLDFGVPGLLAILTVYVAAIVQIVRLGHMQPSRPIWVQVPYLTPRVLAAGWMACMVGQTTYSLFDVVAMGSKPNFVWWWWMALIFAAANCLLPPDKEVNTNL